MEVTCSTNCSKYVFSLVIHLFLFGYHNAINIDFGLLQEGWLTCKTGFHVKCAFVVFLSSLLNLWIVSRRTDEANWLLQIGKKSA
jgi:NADH:ubiquinone oxidoreductase subunit H